MLSYSQGNSEAELLLNKVSENIKNYENIYINYAYTLQNIEEDINQTNNGSFVTEDEMWRFEMLGITRIFDGNKLCPFPFDVFCTCTIFTLPICICNCLSDTLIINQNM